jgi:DNA invertase Pin-like site-specific DNA recombinase
MSAAIGYTRVSTDKQSDGHSLASQRHMIDTWAHTHGLEIIDIIQEIASGGDCDRPMLNHAITECQKTGAKLLVVKLDRLSRDVEHVCQLMKTPRLTLEVIELGGSCDPMTLQLFAVIAEHQRRYISLRTREGLAQARRNGVTLGNPRWNESLGRARKEKSSKANQFAIRLAPVIKTLDCMGHTTLASKADALNALGHKTRRGCHFQPNTVRNLELRINSMEG